ncbi:similar to Saccharomyces cerevisiae YIL136W OM45 Protein of unknown function, major constituent of the mitochondrial outer membrane [Maudiozyma barnettii]|uniref:Uncharacterized protein n=1 Tax=Maudiozyma barnettii TaxID=61262 RepID=A0A8H2ZGB8_9SACH|nr:Om45p [Kazachstania barnettii]CAB4253255.1 similar to Saccharomyces cerevisiae YIL136W OM45 Protein of unknown function, major constituent of the mitochondrial outer membrane [Kazachstania barnettii]CAD1780209.1 similar to Saccharomyces cerevisiae YIL136W OM45 Protein of unknown function, major constituent of the mitochondrial outer membrane [Kazachstania barnettii]
MTGNWYDNLSNGIKDDTTAIWSAFTGSHTNQESSAGARRGSDVMSVLSETSTTDDSVNAPKTIFNRGFGDIERQKAVAINEYDTVHRKYTDLMNKIKQNAETSGFNDQVEKLEKQLAEKKTQLDQASEKFNSYKDANFNRLTDAITPNNGLKKNVDPDIVAGQSVYGWGETAQQLGQEAIEENLNLTNDKNESSSQAQKRLDELKKLTKNGWFTFNDEHATEEQKMAENAAKGLRGWGESAQEFSREELQDLKEQMGTLKQSSSGHLDEAIKKLNDAELNLKESQSSWWSKKNEDSNIHENAVKNYELAKHEYDQAMKDFGTFENKVSNGIQTK